MGEYYGYEEMNIRMIESYMKNRYLIDNLEHPLYSIGHYKLDDLKFIAGKLKINLYDDIGNALKKNDLYEQIKCTIFETI